MAKQSISRPTNSNWTRPMVFTLTVGVLTVTLAVLYAVAIPGPPEYLVIGTGPKGGTYDEVGRRIALAVKEEYEVAGAIVLETTAGSQSNADLLKQGRVDLVLAQAGIELPDNARLVMRLYDEVVHVVVWPDQAETLPLQPDWLRGRRIFLGEKGSGTRRIAEELLEFYDVDVTDVPMSRDQAIEAMKPSRAGERPEIDGVVLMGAYPLPAVEELIDLGATLLTFGSPEEPWNEIGSFALREPAYREFVLPRQAYGQTDAVQTLAVPAMLLADVRLRDSTVRQLTMALFQERGTLASPSLGFDRELPAMQGLRERFSPAEASVPYHSGAESYYRRNEPSFFAANAEQFSLLMGVAGVLFSGAILAWQRFGIKRKNLIDTYYDAVRSLSEDINGADAEGLAKIRSKLDDLKASAFKELVEEKVQADESFVIFQNLWRGEVHALERRLDELARTR